MTDTHDSIVHIAGHAIQVGPHVRQRCSWCGAVLVDEDETRIAVAITDEDPDPEVRIPTWPTGELIEITGLGGTSMTTVLEHADGDPVPDHCCAKLSPEVTR